MKVLGKYFLISGIFLCSLTLANTLPIRVGVSSGYEPMSYIDAQGAPRGIGIEMWEEIAKAQHLSFVYVTLGSNMAENWDKIRQKKIDILLGPVTVDTDVTSVNFSLPFFVNPISAVVPKKTVTFKELLSDAVTDYLIAVMIGYVVFFLIYINLVWFIERCSKFNIQRYFGLGGGVPKKYIEGIGFILYHHITLDSHFFDVKKTNLSRVMYTLYFYATFAFLTVLGATLTAILTTSSVSSANTQVLNESILQQKPFAYMSDRPFFKAFTISRHIAGVPAATMQEAVQMVRTHQVEGIINTQILSNQYLLNNQFTDLAISPYSLGYIFIYIGLPPSSPYETSINDSIVKLQRAGTEAAICRKYQISDTKYCSFY